MGRGIPVWCWRPFARLSALCLAWLAVQIFVYPRAGPDHIQWLVFMIFILCRGLGVLSLDHLPGRRLGLAPWPGRNYCKLTARGGRLLGTPGRLSRMREAGLLEEIHASKFVFRFFSGWRPGRDPPRPCHGSLWQGRAGS